MKIYLAGGTDKPRETNMVKKLKIPRRLFSFYWHGPPGIAGDGGHHPEWLIQIARFDKK